MRCMAIILLLVTKKLLYSIIIYDDLQLGGEVDLNTVLRDLENQ